MNLKLKGASCCSVKSLTKMTKQLMHCNPATATANIAIQFLQARLLIGFDSTQLSPKTSILLSPICVTGQSHKEGSLPG